MIPSLSGDVAWRYVVSGMVPIRLAWQSAMA
jgi:hypothetical protein